MIETDLKRRWYDNHDEAIQAFHFLENLDKKSKERLSEDLVEIVKQIKELRKSDEELTLSLGLKRVLGLYKIGNERRWYDKSENLSYAIKTMSTLPTEDFLNIMEGLTVSLNE